MPKRELGTRGRHQCVPIGHRGDPAGWTRYESLWERFKSINTGEAEVLRELLLMTPNYSFLYTIQTKNNNNINRSPKAEKVCYAEDKHLLTNSLNSNVQPLTACRNQSPKPVTTKKQVNLIRIRRSLIRRENRQLPKATRSSMRPWQGQHYRSVIARLEFCLLYTSPSPRDRQKSRMPSSA